MKCKDKDKENLFVILTAHSEASSRGGWATLVHAWPGWLVWRLDPPKEAPY